MATIYNSDLFKELREGGKIQQLRDTLPNQLAEKVVPVMEVNPKLLRRTTSLTAVTTSATAASSTTILAGNATKDFYITGLSMALTKTALCDVAQGIKSINATVNGVSGVILGLGVETLTASSQQASMTFPIPIKIDRGSNIITSAFAFTAGTTQRQYSVMGYYEDNILA